MNRIDDSFFSFLLGQTMVSGLIGEDEEWRMFGIELTDWFLIIECPWRIRDGKWIRTGSIDLKAGKCSYTDVYDLLRRRKVTKVEFGERTGDLRIEFDRKVWLELFHDSGWFEAWMLRERNGNREFIALPGGELFGLIS
jgi:hypothetical protein